MKKAFFAFAAVLCVGNQLFAEEAPEKATQAPSPWEFSATTSAAYYPEVEHDRGSTHITGISGPYDGIEAVPLPNLMRPIRSPSCVATTNSPPTTM